MHDSDADIEFARGSLTQIELSDLALVAGGEDASFGRCGPGDQWKWLGNVYTPQCAAHDKAVRGELSKGTHPVLAHAKALPLLPAAIGSYVRARLR